MRVELIQELIPLGLAEVGRVLDEEVERLAGPRHARKGEGRNLSTTMGHSTGLIREQCPVW